MLNQFQNMPPYSGTVSVDGTQVEVRDGSGQFEGKNYFVSKDGRFVMNEQMQIVGKIVNGVFAAIEQSDVAELKAMGVLGGQPGAPQGAPPQGAPQGAPQSQQQPPMPAQRGMMGGM